MDTDSAAAQLSGEDLQAIESALTRGMGERPLLIGVWLDPAPFPALRSGRPLIHALFAWPAARLAGLRAWRDQWEGDVILPGLSRQQASTESVASDEPNPTPNPERDHLVALEASHVARLVLKGHGGTLRWLALPAAFGLPGPCGDLCAEIVDLAASRVDAKSNLWLAMAGLAPLPVRAGAAVAQGAIFESLDVWIGRCREATSTRAHRNV